MKDKDSKWTYEKNNLFGYIIFVDITKWKILKINNENRNEV